MSTKSRVNHYKWLDKHLPKIFKDLGLEKELKNSPGIVSAHGDKCYSYKWDWDEAGIKFPHGVAMYLLTYVRPYCDDVGETKNGWVDVNKWVIDNKDKFIPNFPPVDENDVDVRDVFLEQMMHMKG